MKNDKIPIVFFGSGPVAAASLNLLKSEFTIESVVTKPTTKRQMQAVVPDIEVISVADKKELDSLFTTKKFKSSLGILIDFGIIVSNKVIDYFAKGIVNSHFSLLPELRGADPISFAILEDKKETGVSLMLLVKAMDEGPLLAVGAEKLDESETTPTLTKKLIHLSDALLKQTIPAYVHRSKNPASNVIPVPRPQEIIAELTGRNSKPSYTRKLTKADGEIEWGKPAVQIEREIRAYQEWPKSRTTFGNIEVVVLKAVVLQREGPASELFVHDKKLAVYCGSDALVIEVLKPAGKKAMNSQAFLAGYKNRITFAN